MTPEPLSYVVVTPVRNEARNLPRLAESILAQTVRPGAWLVVDTGSTDRTPGVVAELAREYAWIRPSTLRGTGALERGGPIARAFEAGFRSLEDRPDVVVKVDADVSFPDDYFERLLDRFGSDPSLGMASGTCTERDHGEWRERHVTGSTVWGAARAYRSECLIAVLPLEQRMGWDGVDEFRANARGWRTRTFKDLQFRHHRREGERDGSQRRARRAQGHAAYFLGYRFWYLALRALWHARKEPAALAMLQGYVEAWAGKEPQCGDAEARLYLRTQQSIGRLPMRIREAFGRHVLT